MSRLWPERLEVGLFPRRCWLTKVKQQHLILADLTSASDLLVGFELCLAQAEGKGGGRLNLAVTVSDTVAAIVPLPWQDGLKSTAEWHGYAQLCFEKLGRDVGPDWVMHVEYPRHRAAGLAYALPRPWMQALLAKAEEKRMRIERVLPISAQAFCGGVEPARLGLTIVLLFETTQHTALVFENGTLLAREVEPYVQGAAITCRRLLARVLATGNSGSDRPVHIAWWAYNEQEIPDEVVQALAKDAKVTPIAAGAWA